MVATIRVGNGPFGLALNSTLNLVYVANLTDGTISVIDAASQAVTNTFTLPKSAKPGTITYDAKAAQRGEEKPLKVHDHAPDAFRYFAKQAIPSWRLGYGRG